MPSSRAREQPVLHHTLERVVGHLHQVDPPRSHRCLQVGEARRLPVGGPDDVDPTCVSVGLDLLEPPLPADHVVDLEHLDVATEEGQRTVDLRRGLVVVGCPHLGGDHRLLASLGQRRAEDLLGALPYIGDESNSVVPASSAAATIRSDVA